MWNNRRSKEYRERKDKWCDVEGKRSHTSKKQAREFSADLDNRLRVYPCKFCHGWHISDAEKDLPGRNDG